MSESQSDSIVLREDHGSVSVITLNEPARMNPFGDAMRERLAAALVDLMSDPSVRVIILTGNGGNFSAGADVRQMQSAGDRPDPQRSRQRLAVLQGIVRQITTGPKPVIAAVEGVAFGAGLSTAIACDYVIVGEGARLGAAFGKIGLAPDCGLLWSLPQRIGLSRSRDLIFTGRPMDASSAADIGMADFLVPTGLALTQALAKAREYLDTAPLSIAATKAALAELPSDLEQAFKIELHQQPLLSSTVDHAEARVAFMAKRKPVFIGR